MGATPQTLEPLWRPHRDQITNSNLTRFQRWLHEERALDLNDHRSLYDWSVRDLDGFWGAIADFFGVRFHIGAERVLQRDTDPLRTRWFPGGTVNYAEHMLRFGQNEVPVSDDRLAVLYCTEPGEFDHREVLTRKELIEQVTQLASAFSSFGVRCGDRIAGYLPNRIETLVAFLATASLGAIWSNCPPELSSRGVLERLTQIEPKVLLSVFGYRYAGKTHDRTTALAEIAAGLPTLRQVIVIPPIPDDKVPDFGGAISVQCWSDLVGPGRSAATLRFRAVPFDHPLWILYSSGTTGLPKPIAHGHGGILLEHLKALSLHLDLQPEDRFFWFTTAGWMMWNFLVSGLALGTSVILYDGSPKYPDFGVLWKLSEMEGINYFGTSAAFLLACQKEQIEPGKEFRLQSLRCIGSTGAPLPADGFQWVYDKVKTNVWLGSASGGTDVCTAFVLPHPWLPVYAGKLQCRGLGAPIEAWDDRGRPLWNEVGELVLTAPMPCMPVCFWNDPDGSRLRQAYFEHYPGVWRHGDWIEIDAGTGQCVIYGRSDSTLNRGGIRMGTSEFYRVVESVPEVLGSLVIDTSGLGQAGKDASGGRLLLFVVLREALVLDQALISLIREQIKTQLSPRYVPDAIFAVPEIPQTLNGKKMEVPVKRIFQGAEVTKSFSREAMSNPDSLKPFLEVAERYRRGEGVAGG
jgi:acetoacetyl-CoA synthetase